ncbi:siroheme decarboxylase subunit alpha [Desulfoscipio gibsoniae]|uniref:siroheme decarboxylase n=1 Tax=Desulfoscipio gibsoniae DSM 7213 TaxID=767817 RepID=R4KLB1_9FIRM|nr:AsnC family transcriptional regulator [Desulfoscipio gibsoniae]AGL02362.1 transcriptional regulator [Desulfoscipio gibsoniae DSM 7213]
MNLDRIDRKILQVIQSDFPLMERPYLQVAESVGISEGEVLERIGRMQEEGLIRRLGGLFNSRKLGYTGTLCALRVPHEDIERVAGIINEYHGVTHNYLRNHEYNMWFTMLAESENKLDELLTEIRQKTGITQILNLPAVNLFKVRVNFNL